MKKFIVAALALAFATVALAQSYPSPTFNNVTINGTATIPHAAITGGTITGLSSPLPVSSGGTNSAVPSGTALDNISGFSSTGFLTRTGAGSYSFQSLTNGITLGNLAQQAANTVLANATGSTANVTAFSMPSCSSATSALQWTSGTGFTCYGNSASLTGATFTGNVTVSNANAQFVVNDSSGTGHADLYFDSSGTPLWDLRSTGSTGAFALNRYVSGVNTDSPVSVSNSTGLVTFADGITANGTNTINGYAPLASPAFTGTPTAPTAALGTSTTQLATTAFVANHEGCKNVLDFGGNNSGGGASANNTAWTNAIAAQSSNNSVCVYFPPGNYAFNSGLSYTITNTNSSITIAGDGSNLATLTFPSGVNGITLTTKDYTSSVHLRGFTLATQGVGTSTGLTITQGAASIANEANTAASDIYDVTFMGSTGYTGANYWNIGTSVFAVSNISYISDYWVGSESGSPTGQGSGVVIAGTSATLAAVVHNFIGCDFVFHNIALQMGLWAQGVSLTAVNITEDNVGVNVPNTATGGVVQLAIANSQFSTYSNGVQVSGALTNVSITNNLFYVGASASAVVVNNSSSTDYNISNNQIFPGFSPVSPNGVAVLAAAAGSNIITGNIFNTIGTGISLSASAPGWNIGENVFTSVTTPISNSATSYTFKTGAAVSGNSCGTGVPAASTYYLAMCLATTTESSSYMIAPQPLTAGQLQVRSTTAPGASQTYTATLRVNGAATAMTCSISGSSSQNCSDTTHTVAIPAGSVYDVQFVSSASAATAGVSWGMAVAP